MSYQDSNICPRITSKYIKNKIPFSITCLGTGLTFPGASSSEVQGNCLAVTNKPEQGISSKPDDTVRA